MPTAHSGLDHLFRMIAPYQPWKYGIIPVPKGSEAGLGRKRSFLLSPSDRPNDP